MKKGIPLLVLLALLMASLSGCQFAQPRPSSMEAGLAGGGLNILMSEDIRPLEPVLEAYFSGQENTDYAVTYEGIADIRRILEQDTGEYDAVWLSNSIALHLLDGGQRIGDSAFTAISPVVFAVKESSARALGLTGDIAMRDIVDAIKSGALSFVMPSVTQTNSGLSAYIGILSALLGSSNVLTVEDLSAPHLQEDLTAFFAGVSRSSGSDAYAADLVLSYGYDCIVASEADVIRLNRTLEAEGQETMRLLYPADGVTIGDAPLAYIDRGNPAKREAFLSLQAFVLGSQGQELLAGLGMRTDLGGLISSRHSANFPEAWGIRGDEYIQTIVYPSKAFLSEALTLYQELFRKPSHTVFCLDFSGSMQGQGIQDLLGGMEYILNPEKASGDYIQFTQKDQVTIVVFSSTVEWIESRPGDESIRLYRRLAENEVGGNTFLHSALLDCLGQLQDVDTSQVSASIVLMTDGEASEDRASLRRLESLYENGEANIPIFSILYGSASAGQLIPLAEMSGGAVFDGKEDLAKAFRAVRGYN